MYKIGPHTLLKGVHGSERHIVNMPERHVQGINLKHRLWNRVSTGNEGALVRRHEADEVKHGDRIQKKHGVAQGVSFTKYGMHIGGHGSPRVLKDEKKLTDFTTKAYGVGKHLTNMRKHSGEYETVSKMSNRQINRLEKPKPWFGHSVETDDKAKGLIGRYIWNKMNKSKY